MASILDKSVMASSLGNRFLGLSLSSTSSVSLERVKAPLPRCSVGASLPRNTSPKKSRTRDGRARSPVSRADPTTSSLARPLFGDPSQPQLSPAQRLEAPRAAVIAAPLCEDPSSISSWHFRFVDDDEDSPVHSPPSLSRTVSPPASSAVGSVDWLSSTADEPISWQRSMLETHWLLDSPELARQQPLDEPEGVPQVKGITRRNRARRKHLLPTEPSPTTESESETSPEDSLSGVVVRSSLSARERRRLSRQSVLEASGESSTSSCGSLSKLNLQVVCNQKARLRASSPAAFADIHPSPSDLEPAAPNRPLDIDLSEAAAPSTAPSVAASMAEKAPDDVSTNHVWSFMRDIGYAKLLTREEEVELATTFRAGERLKEARATLEQQKGSEASQMEWAWCVGLTVQQLRHRVQQGERSRERLIAANMRLVVSVVKKYTRPGVSVADLVTAGTVGLARGVDRFDPTKGFKLSTYVHWWIRQAVTRAAAQHVGAYHLPMHVHETLAKVKKVKADLTAQGQAPTHENIANYLGVSKKRITKVLKLKLKAKSLDDACPCPVGFSEGSSFHNFVYDEEEDLRSWIKIEAKLLKTDLSSIMVNKLNVRERDILCMHYGIDSKDGNGITLDNISTRYGVSRERVRQVEMVAIRKLKALCLNKDLKRYCY